MISSSSVSTAEQRSGRRFTYERLKQLSQVHGEAFYVFDEDKFRDNFTRLNSAFTARYGQTRIAYSYKTNYTPWICRLVNELGGYAEVVSEMEYGLARRLGIESGRIIYNGPYKSWESIRDAVRSGAIVNLDSMRDYENIISVAAAEPERRFAVGVRCNFDLPGTARSRFGVDVRGTEFRTIVDGIRRSRNITLAGLHCHFPSRDLPSFQIRAEALLKIAQETFTEPPVFLDLGGGFYGDMPKSLARIHRPPSFPQYAKAIGDLFRKAYGNGKRAPVLFIEPGTALVADTFKFYATVINVKEIDKRQIATVAGSIFNISPHSRTPNLPVRAIRRSSAGGSGRGTAIYDVAGYTCIEGDFLSKGLRGPIRVGDFLEYGNLGSYSIVMKPPFIAPNVPVLKLSGDRGEPAVIKRRETADYIFQMFSEA